MNSRGEGLRILLHSRSFFPRLGGLEQAGLSLARELGRRGCEVIVATDVSARAEVDRALGFEVVRGRSLRDLAALARRCDIVHANGFSLTSVNIALPAGRPLVFTHHGYQASCLEGLGWHGGGHCQYRLPRCVALTARHLGPLRAARQLGRHAVGRAALHLAAAHGAVSAYVARILAAPRTRVVLNCVETSLFYPAPAKGERRRFLFFGRFVAEKGVDVLLRAVAMAVESGADIALDLVGGGPLEGEYRARVRSLGLEERVAFRGVLRGESLADAVRESLAVVVPSVWDEAFGIAAAEAIACGRVALVSDAGGLPEVVEGLDTAVPPGDTEAWARALRRAREDEGWREGIEKRLPAVAARFTPERLAQDYLSIYGRVLAGPAVTKDAEASPPYPWHR